MKRYNLINDILGWVCFAVAAVTYLLTVEPTASFWDCPEFISQGCKLEVGHPPGNPIFMLAARFFVNFAFGDVTKVALMVNSMSALLSAATILLLFWTITHLVKRLIIRDNAERLSLTQMLVIFGSGICGALAYTWSDTFWFSAVEGEVYAFSSFCTALVFWLILKWENRADQPHSDKYLILIAYVIGISIAVHLLNLLCIPAIGLVIYYRLWKDTSATGSLITLAVSAIVVGLILYGLVPGFIEVSQYFELFFVNTLGFSYNVGVLFYAILAVASFIWAIRELYRQTSVKRIRWSVALSILLSGIPFIGNSMWIPVVIMAGVIGYLFWSQKLPVRILNLVVMSIFVIFIGYSSYALLLIRSSANPPMNQNAPDNVFALASYLNREQYGERPLFYGQTHQSSIVYEADPSGQLSPQYSNGAPQYSKVTKSSPDQPDKYIFQGYKKDYRMSPELDMLFPRIYSGAHTQAYSDWIGGIKGTPTKVTQYVDSEGNVLQYTDRIKPTFGESLRFFLVYQLNHMYWRYFMWNFSGRQNDIQGNGEVSNGNWITGIPFIDEALVGPQEDMPFDIINNKGHNVYYMLPLLLGILGLLFQAYAGKKGIQGFWITFFLFFMTGIAIVLYLNQAPYQPRERDYAYAGSFYAFCIWIGFGVAALAKGLQKYGKLSPVIAGSVATVLCLLVPIQMGAQNWDDHDRSNRYVCRDFGANYLESCEPNAVIFTNGDNDTFPLWYAQEVEGIRTDVRVCNTSYLQTDWYINQMKKQAYESDPLPISWQPEDYVQGTRDAAYVFPMTDKSIDLKTALDFVRSNDPKFKKIPGINQELDYIPAQTLTMGVDSAAVMAAGVIDTANLPYLQKEMKIDLKGKDVLGKQELIILDMLQTNDWNRPIYYAITVSPDQFVKLDPYFQQTGMAYQIVPMETQGTVRSINTEKMYDNVMNKFKWGGVNTPGVYLDENVMRMCKSYRIALFSKLAAALVAEGKNEKALNVLDKAMEVLPPENVPLDYSALSLGELYYELGQKEKAEMVYKGIADNAMRSINWYFRLRPGQLSSVESDLGHNLAVLQEVLRVSKQYNPEFAKPYQEEFDNYRMAYGSVAKD